MTKSLDPLTTFEYPWNLPFFGRTKLVHQRFQNACWLNDRWGGRVQINLVRERIDVDNCKQFSQSWTVGFGLDAIGVPVATVNELGPTGNPLRVAMMFTITDLDPYYKGAARPGARGWTWPMWKSLHESKYTSGYWSDLIGEDSGINTKIYPGRNQFVVDPFVIEWIRQLFYVAPNGTAR